jgi:hypothetical protein
MEERGVFAPLFFMNQVSVPFIIFLKEELKNGIARLCRNIGIRQHINIETELYIKQPYKMN